MTVREKQVRDAAFWELEFVCLDCGEGIEALKDDDATCGSCGSPNIIDPVIGVLVLDNVERDEG